MSLLDVRPDDFAPLSRVTSREEGMQVSQLFGHAPSVREWLLCGFVSRCGSRFEVTVGVTF